MSRKKRKEILDSIRNVQGLNWILPYSRLPKPDREKALRPILEATTDSKTRRAIEVVIEHGKENLTKLASGEGNYRRLFSWDSFYRYMLTHRISGREYQRRREASA